MPIDTTSDVNPHQGRHVHEPPAELPSPRAARAPFPKWLNVRLIVGALLVLVSLVVGARVIAAADRTVPVLVAAEDLAPGQPLTGELVEQRGVLLDDGLDRYFTGDVGSGYVMIRPVDHGELLPRSAVIPATELADLRYVTVAIPGLEAPPGLSAGAVVDAWLTPADGTGPAELLLADVTVTATSTDSGGLAEAAGQFKVTLAVVTNDADEVMAELVAAARAGLVYLAAVPEMP